MHSHRTPPPHQPHTTKHALPTENMFCVAFPQVTVIDSPVTTRQSTVWVIVHIEDENDNRPTFPEATYRISLPERDRNRRVEPVYRVFAYDRDSGANGNITYSITDGNEEDNYSIDPKTAMVSSKKMVPAGSYDILTVSVKKLL